MAPQKAPPIKCNIPYLFSWNLLLKTLEIVAAIVTLVISLQFSGSGAIIAIQILSALAAVTSLFWVILYILNINQRFPDFFGKLLVGYHVMMALFMIVVTVCAGYLIPQFKVATYLICCVIAAVCALMFIVDSIIFTMALRDGADIKTCCCSPEEPEIAL